MDILLREDSALNSLLRWFQEKKAQLREIFENMKDKLTNMFRTKTDWKVQVDIINDDGKKVLSAGASKVTIAGFFKNLLNDIKNLCSTAIGICSAGISAITGKDFGKANVHKNKALKSIDVIKKRMKLFKKASSALKTHIDNKVERKVDKEISKRSGDLRRRERAVERKEMRWNSR